GDGEQQTGRITEQNRLAGNRRHLSVGHSGAGRRRVRNGGAPGDCRVYSGPRGECAAAVSRVCGSQVNKRKLRLSLRKERNTTMKRTIRITTITLFALVLAGLASLAVLVLPDVVKAAGENSLTFDVACDCRTFVSGPNRGDPFIVNGKIFPAGTLPSG